MKLSTVYMCILHDSKVLYIHVFILHIGEDPGNFHCWTDQYGQSKFKRKQAQPI